MEREKKEAISDMENQRAQVETLKKEINLQKETLQGNRTKIDALKHAKLALQSEMSIMKKITITILKISNRH